MIKLLNIRCSQTLESREECSTLLLFANKCEEDILWREELEELCHSSPQ